MKVFNLSCAHDHQFEGWFGSADDFDSQLSSGMIECPICGDKGIHRMPSAPRLNLSSAHASKPQGDKPEAPAMAVTPEQIQALWLKMARHIRENTEDVGGRFAEEARRIHYHETQERGIRGVASRDETLALAEEGIEVFSFPMPKGSNEPLQ